MLHNGDFVMGQPMFLQFTVPVDMNSKKAKQNNEVYEPMRDPVWLNRPTDHSIQQNAASKPKTN